MSSYTLSCGGIVVGEAGLLPVSIVEVSKRAHLILSLTVNMKKGRKMKTKYWKAYLDQKRYIAHLSLFLCDIA